MAVTSRPLMNAPSSGSGVYLLSQAITLALALVAVVVVALAVQAGLNWGERRVDDLRYGFPRMARASGAVGFGDSPQVPTEVIALNSDGQISIIVLPAGDSARISVLPGPYLVGEDGPYTVPRPTLTDVNEDNKQDLIISVRGEDLVYLNRGDQWTMITPEERTQLLEKLRGA